jgi:hypothetical protein
VAVLILVFLIFVIFSLPYLLPKKQESFDHAGFATFKSEAARLGVDRETGVHSKEEKLSRSTLVPGKSGRYVSSSQGEGASIAELFYFDPNSLTAEGWKKLGLPDRNIRTIRNYLLKGREIQERGRPRQNIRAAPAGCGAPKTLCQDPPPYSQIHAGKARASTPV